MKDEKLMGHDPLSDSDAILRDTYYGREEPKKAATPAGKPTHYKVICISMYTQDIEELETKVAELKKRGWTKANKSQLIRLALSKLDLDALGTPRQ
jgi:hypothetical protein